jgi:1,4-dihydroxy-2-naphthoate octaprenyltransferase
MINKPTAWLLAARPKTLPASLGPVLLGSSLAATEQIKAMLPLLIITALCALLMQVGTNLVNDYFDSERGLDGEKRLGPSRAAQMGWLTRSELKKGIVLVFATAFCLGLTLMNHGGLPIIIIGLLSLAMAFLYTGGPYPLSYFALGEVLALIFFGPVPVWGTYFIITKSFDWMPVLIGFIPGFVALSLMAINNLRDHENDKENKKTTLAVLLGPEKARYLVIFGIFMSSMIPLFLFFLYHNYIFLLASFLFLKNYRTWRRILSAPITSDLNNALATTGKYLFILCFVVAMGFINWI